jgi:hypothetical protein
LTRCFIPAEPLAAFGRLAWQLLQDVQERLVFRAHLYLKSDIEQYRAAPGDLAYPEKLEMMEVSTHCNSNYNYHFIVIQIFTEHCPGSSAGWAKLTSYNPFFQDRK